MSETTWVDEWVSHYLAAPEMLLAVPDRVALAQLRMFRQAELHEEDVGPKFELHLRIQEDPHRPALWAHCGSAARLFQAALAEHGIVCELRELAYAVGSYHVAVEYGTPEGMVAYDPTYGAWVSDGTRRLGMAAILAGLDGGLAFTVEPPDPYELAASTGYEETFNAQDYSEAVLARYFNALCYREGPGGGHTHRVFVCRTDITEPPNPDFRPTAANLQAVYPDAVFFETPT